MVDKNQQPFTSEVQNGIFQWFFALIEEYNRTMSPQDSFRTAIDWVQSFVNEMKAQYVKIQEDQKDFDQKIKQS